jgi:hypothetical protein
MDVHYSSMLCSLVDSRVEWYVECAGWMSGEVSYVIIKTKSLNFEYKCNPLSRSALSEGFQLLQTERNSQFSFLVLKGAQELKVS